ncbi:MAG: HAD family hydrolase [Eubacterium sp.]|nr:HAD family hydrolase [Eubacterium sp.]
MQTRTKRFEQNQKKKNVQRPAVFLDRDGVLTEERGYISSTDELHIFPYVTECIRQIHKKGYYAIVVTNQSGVARGFFTEETLQKMNEYLMQQTHVDAVYYCPHHPEGVVEKYRIVCDCRKPQTGMFQNACKEFDIDVANSYMVGDRASDVIAGKNEGLRTVILESGYGMARLEKSVKPDYVFKDLRGVIEIL